MGNKKTERKAAPRVADAPVPTPPPVEDELQNDITTTDDVLVEVASDEEVTGDGSGEALPTFEEVIEVDDSAERESEAAEKMVTIRPRQNVSRTKIIGRWYTFIKGQEITVPRHVREWLLEKGIL